MTAGDVGSALENSYTKRKGLIAHNPYRFVWLDGCSTASGKDWRRAFGIYPIGKGSQQQAARNKTGPQAYVGWANDVAGMLNRSGHSQDDVEIVQAYTKTLTKFYVDWMSGFTAKACLDRPSSQDNLDCVPLPVPKNKNMKLIINFNIYEFENVHTSKLYLVGFPGLRVDGTDHSLDTDTTYAAPQNTE